MDNEHPRLKAWKSAEKAARAIERDVRDLLINRSKGELPAGVEERMAAAAALRVTAHRLLEEALREVEVSAKALHYRNVSTPTIRPLEAWGAASPGDAARAVTSDDATDLAGHRHRQP